MKIVCQQCGQTTEVNGLGRKPKAMPVIIICDTIQETGSVSAAALKLGCSRAYVYKVLKANGIDASDIEKRREISQDLRWKTPSVHNIH